MDAFKEQKSDGFDFLFLVKDWSIVHSDLANA